MLPKKKAYLLTSFLSVLIIIVWLVTLKQSLYANLPATSSKNLDLKQSWQSISEIIHEFRSKQRPAETQAYNPQSTAAHFEPGQLEKALKNINLIIQSNSSTPTSTPPVILPINNKEKN